MRVSELIAELSKYPQDFEVHLDVSSSDEPNSVGGWEGDRVVRHVAGCRVQAGYRAVAIDADSYITTVAKGFTDAEE